MKNMQIEKYIQAYMCLIYIQEKYSSCNTEYPQDIEFSYAELIRIIYGFNARDTCLRNENWAKLNWKY